MVAAVELMLVYLELVYLQLQYQHHMLFDDFLGETEKGHESFIESRQE